MYLAAWSVRSAQPAYNHADHANKADRTDHAARYMRATAKRERTPQPTVNEPQACAAKLEATSTAVGTTK
eukprot:2542712-Lingulodinium_polyedra.AAC.1